MYFAGHLIRTGLTINGCPDIAEVMLYNGRRVMIRGPFGDEHGLFDPGSLLKFYADGNEGTSGIDLEKDQPEGGHYTVANRFCSRITDEGTIKAFFIGACIFEMFRSGSIQSCSIQIKK